MFSLSFIAEFFFREMNAITTAQKRIQVVVFLPPKRYTELRVFVRVVLTIHTDRIGSINSGVKKNPANLGRIRMSVTVCNPLLL